MQAALRARSAHIVRCPQRSTHIAAMPMKDYVAPPPQRSLSDPNSSAGEASPVFRKSLPEALLSRMALRALEARIQFDRQPLLQLPHAPHVLRVARRDP